MKSSQSPIFIGGAGRSGTTLLRVILDSHPQIICGPELKVTPSIINMWNTFQSSYGDTLREFGHSRKDINAIFQQFIYAFLEPYQQQQDGKRIAEKTPNNVFFFQQLRQLFPDSPLIQIIRDGRGVVCSLLEKDWKNRETGEPVSYTESPREAALYWKKAVKSGQLAREEQGNGSYIEVRYEDIVQQTEQTLKTVFRELEEPWDDSVLQFHKRPEAKEAGVIPADEEQPITSKSLGRWRNDLPEEAQQIVKQTAGDVLRELGYQ